MMQSLPQGLVDVVILTYNEEIHIERAIRSVKNFARAIFVIDSYSTDHTASIAKSLGATVLQNKFVNYARQFQWALDNAPITALWTMRLDADEIIEADLSVEILNVLPSMELGIAGLNLRRKHIFMNKWVRHGGRYPLSLLRIWRTGQGRIEDRWMDEHIVIWGGAVVELKGGFSDWNLNDLTFFTAKHNKYATREAIDVINQKRKLFARDEVVSASSTSMQAAFKRWAKERVYNKLPFTVSSTLYFLWRYIFQLGFLDGRSGLTYHFLQGYWYRFLVGAKLMELEKAIEGLSSREEILAELSRLTGHPLQASNSK